jgi:hypothetical protein
MTLRLLLWSAYWAVALTVAGAASLAAAIPFTGDAASCAGLLAATGVCLIACAVSPTTPTTSRKARS